METATGKEGLEVAPTLYFDHRMTNRIKGIAIIMMMILHFFTVPQWYLSGISYPELSTFAKLYYQPFELCVPVFACLTGLFCGIRPSCDFRYAFRKITDLLIGYWLIYLLIIIVVLVLGTHTFTFTGILLEMIGYRRPIMMFCWYVFFYMCSMLVIALLDKLPKNSPLLSVMAYIILPTLVSTMLQFWCRHGDGYFLELNDNFRTIFMTMGMGYIISRYDLFHRFFDRILKDNFRYWWIRIPLWCALLYVAFIGRFYIGEISIAFLNMQGEIVPFTIRLDIIYAPLFIYCLVNLFECIPARQILLFPLEELGRVSMEIWFIHCIFFAEATKKVFMPILYWPGHPVLVTLWGLALCFAVAWILDWPIRFLIRQKNKLFLDTTVKSV